MKRLSLFLPCALVLILVFGLVMVGCSGCAGKAEKEAGQVADSQVLSPSDPKPGTSQASVGHRGVSLSQSAMESWAYLILSQALMQSDEAMLAKAMPILKKCRLTSRIWMEGGIWLMGKKSPLAIPFLDQAVTLWPEDLSINLLYAETLTAVGKSPQAVGLMQKYISSHPDSIDAKIELALLLVKTRQFGEAEKIFSNIPASAYSPLVGYYHARALGGMEKWKEAIPKLNRALKEQPDFPECIAELAFAHEQLGHLQEARKFYENLLNYSKSDEDITLRLIGISLQQQNPEQAMLYFKEKSRSSKFCLSVANMFMESKNFPFAENLLQEILQSASVPPEAYLLAAELDYEQKGDANAAFAWLEKIPPNDKIQRHALMMRAQIFLQTGKHDDALAAVQKGKGLFPDAPEFVDAEIRLLAKGNKPDKALDVARQATARWAEDENFAFLLGSLLDETGDKKSAIEIMEQIIAKNPKHYQALNYIGYSLAEESRDLDRAIALLVRANEISPNQSYIVDSLAWALFKAGKKEDALLQIRKAVSLEKTIDPSIWEHYGEIALSLGLKDEARSAYQKALENNPTDADALRRRLSEI